MKSPLHSRLLAATVALVASALVCSAASNEPDLVRGRPQTRGASSAGVQYFLESAVRDKEPLFVRLVVIQDRPDDYANYNQARLAGEDGAADVKLKTVSLARQPLVGSSGVREVVAVYLSQDMLDNGSRLNLEIEGPSEMLKIGVRPSYVKSFVKRLKAATK